VAGRCRGRSLGRLDGEPPQLLDLRAQTLVEFLELTDVVLVSLGKLRQLAFAALGQV
jgi:hypothetical protein